MTSPNSNLLVEKKTPAQQAHELGLTHSGWGYWADSSGKKVARTVGDELVKLEPGEEQDKANSSHHAITVTAKNSTWQLPDYYAQQLSAEGIEALEHLAKIAYGHMGLTGQVNAQMMAQMEIIIAKIIETNQISYNDTKEFFDLFDLDEAEPLFQYLNSLLDSKSKLIAAIKIKANQEKELLKLIQKLEAPKPQVKSLWEPDAYTASVAQMYPDAHDQKYPEPDNVSHYEPGDDNVDSDGFYHPEPMSAGSPDASDKKKKQDIEEFTHIDLDHVFKLLGINTATKGYEEFLTFMHDLDKAETGPAVNYVSQKLKKAGLIDQQQWKQLHKYLKSVKKIKQGPALPGKIKKNIAHSKGEPAIAHVLKHVLDGANGEMYWSGIPIKDAGILIKAVKEAQNGNSTYKLFDLLASHGVAPKDIDFAFKQLGIQKKVKLPPVEPSKPAATFFDQIAGKLSNGFENAADQSWNQLDQMEKDALYNLAYDVTKGGDTEDLYNKLVYDYGMNLNAAEVLSNSFVPKKAAFKPLSTPTPSKATADGADLKNGETSPFPVPAPGESENGEWKKVSVTDKAWVNKALEVAAKEVGLDMKKWSYTFYSVFAAMAAAYITTQKEDALPNLKNVFHMLSKDKFPEEYVETLLDKLDDVRMLRSGEHLAKFEKQDDVLQNMEDPSTWESKIVNNVEVAVSHVMSEYYEETGSDLNLNNDGMFILKNIVKKALGAENDVEAFQLLKKLPTLQLGLTDNDVGHLDKIVTKLRMESGKTEVPTDVNVKNPPVATPPVSSAVANDWDNVAPWHPTQISAGLLMSQKLIGQAAKFAGVDMNKLPPQLQSIILNATDEAMKTPGAASVNDLAKELTKFGIPPKLRMAILNNLDSAKLAYNQSNKIDTVMPHDEIEAVVTKVLNNWGDFHLGDLNSDEQMELIHAAEHALKWNNPAVLQDVLQGMNLSGNAGIEILHYLKQAQEDHHDSSLTGKYEPSPFADPNEAELKSKLNNLVSSKAEKAAATSMNPDKWAKGDADKVIKWLHNKFKAADSKTKPAFSSIALALVKNHGVSLGSLPPDMVPDELKNFAGMKSSEKKMDMYDAKSAVENSVNNWVMASPEEKIAVGKNMLKLLKDIDFGSVPHDTDETSQWVETAWDGDVDKAIGVMIQNLTAGGYDEDTLQTLKDCLQAKYGQIAPVPITKNHPPDESPNTTANTEHDAVGIANNYKKLATKPAKEKLENDMHVLLAGTDIEYYPEINSWLTDHHNGNVNAGIKKVMDDMAKGTEIAQLSVLKALLLKKFGPIDTPKEEPVEVEPDEEEPAKSAIEIQTTIDKSDPTGYANNMLADNGIDFNTLSADKKKAVIAAVTTAFESPTEVGVAVALDKLKKAGISQDALDAMKYDIISKSALDSSPDAFKNHFDYEEHLDDFLSKQPAFAATLSPEDKQKMLDAMKTGLAMPTYAAAKQYYQDKLVGTIPGFNETMFSEFRHSVSKYHDQLKDATKYVQAKKAELDAKKKAEAENKAAFEKMQKALDAMGKGDVKQTIQSIMTTVGVDKMDGVHQKQVVTAIAKAITADTTQDMLDALDTLRGYDAYTSNPDEYDFGTTVVGDPAKFKLLRQLVSVAHGNIKHPPPKNPPKEPTVQEPAEIRAKRVFKNWLDQYRMTIGHVPSTGYQERTNLVKAVVDAIEEPDPKKVNNHLYGLLVGDTSLGDEHIEQLRKLVQQEREKPEKLQGKPTPVTSVPQHTISGNSNSSKTPKVVGPQSPLMKDPIYKKKMKYYGVDTANSNLSKTIDDALASHVVMMNKVKISKQIQAALTANFGIPAEKAKNLANWATHEAMVKSPLHQQAILTKNSQSQVAPAGVGNITDPIKAKEKLINLPSSLDPHGVLKGEWVKGEKVQFNTGDVSWTRAAPDKGWATTAAQTQATWRKKHLSADMNKNFGHVCGSWQGQSQWGKSPNHRKAMCALFHKAVEGPPPMTAKMESHAERGMNMHVNDFKEYIKAFEIGKPVYIGPSGFSGNRGTALNFGNMNYWSHSNDRVKVLLRVVPPKTGDVKVAVLPSYGSEQEMVFGTNKNTVCRSVTKHLLQTGGQYYPVYEIEMEYDPTLKEVLTEEVSGEVGFEVKYWKGLSPQTVKMLIKHNNTSVFHTA